MITRVLMSGYLMCSGKQLLLIDFILVEISFTRSFGFRLISFSLLFFQCLYNHYISASPNSQTAMNHVPPIVVCHSKVLNTLQVSSLW